MSEFTNGPWEWSWANWRNEIDGLYAYVAGDRFEDDEGVTHTGVCRVEGNATSRTVTEANARLISAAPDLLAACKQALLKFDEVYASRTGAMPDAVQNLKRAIAKAEGH